jgi:hypothetical protein
MSTSVRGVRLSTGRRYPLVFPVILVLLLLFPLLLTLPPLVLLLLRSALLLPLPLLLESVGLEPPHTLVPLLWFVVHQMEGVLLPGTWQAISA